MYYQNNWKLHQRIPKDKKRIRLKRKERMTWQEWFQDWYRALHSFGWTCWNRGITENRVRLTEEEVSNLEALYMQKGTTVVYLYPSIETVPQRGSICEGWMSCIKPIKNVIRIVRGRRPDPARGVTRVDDGTGTGIIPNWDCSDLEPFYVDFDAELFEPTGRGDWQLTQNEESKEVYGSYLNESPHFKSFRKYVQAPKPMDPLHSLLACGSNLVGKE